jgi:hypothetical protein
MRQASGERAFPLAEAEGEKVLLSQAELALLLGGIDLLQTQRRRWHRIATAVEKTA